MAIMIAKKIVQNMQGFSSIHFEIFLSQFRGFDSDITEILTGWRSFQNYT